jgi:rRNA processing protein Krr1/Pno1
MKARIRPVGHPDNVTVLNRVLMKVIKGVSKVKVVAYLAQGNRINLLEYTGH